MGDTPPRLVQISEWVFLALVVVLPVMQPSLLQFGTFPIPIADALFLVAMTAAGLGWLQGPRKLRVAAWPLAVLAYLAASALSAAWSIDIRSSAIKLAGTTYLCGLGWLTFQHASTPRGLRRVTTAWCLGTAITIGAAAVGVVLFYAGVTGAANPFLYPFGSLPPGPYPRVMALFLNANALCTYAAASAMIALSATAAGDLPAWAGRLLFAGSVATAVLTVSPVIGGLLLALALWYAAALRPRRPLAARYLSVLGGLAALAFLAATTVSPTGEGPSSRVMVWNEAWQVFLQNPLLGIGLGEEVAHVHYLNASGELEYLTDAHNLWLSILAQQGLVGAAAFALVIALLIWPAERLSPSGEPRAVRRSGLVLGLLAGVLYAGLSGAFEDTRHVWVLMGLAASARFAPHA